MEDIDEKPKRTRTMTPELLQKLAKAREKALEIKRKKGTINKVVKEEEKKKKYEELDQQYNNIVKGKQEEHKEDTDNAPEKVNKVAKPHEAPQQKSKIKKILQPASDESSSDSSSDSEYDASPIAQKYKQKYKNKYQAKYSTPHTASQQFNPYTTTPYQDAYMIAKHSLQSKLHNELQKTAFNSLFG